MCMYAVPGSAFYRRSIGPVHPAGLFEELPQELPQELPMSPHGG